MDLARLPNSRTRLLDLDDDGLRQDFLATTAGWALEAPFYAVHNGSVQLVCGRHADVLEVYQDRERFSVQVPRQSGFERFDKFMGVETLAQIDGTRHDQLRRLLSGAFGPNSVRAFEDSIETFVAELFSPLVQSNASFDLMADIAAKLIPGLLLGLMYGMDESEKAIMVRMSEAVPLATRLKPGESFPRTYISAFDDARALISRLVESRRRKPGSDLISQLVLAESEGDRLNGKELFDQIFSITAGALQSTSSSFAACAWVLHSHPAALERLRGDHGLVGQAVDECLRYHGPGFLTFPRFAKVDTEVGGTFIPAGMVVRPSPQAANLDPSVFPDPLVIDLDRNLAKVLTFGAGPHICLGNRMARSIVRIALRQYLECFPRARLVEPSFRPHYRGQVSETQIVSLPVSPH